MISTSLWSLGPDEQDVYLQIRFGAQKKLLWPFSSKSPFDELVPGFWAHHNQTSLGLFSGLSLSIIIEKKLNFDLWVSTTGSFRVGARQNAPKKESKAYKSQRKSPNFTKIGVHVCPNMVRKHAEFREDRTIGGAIIGKNVSFLLGVQARSAENLLYL